MDKLEFDSLHKFLVSLGLIFIALPFLLLVFFFNSDIVLISQEEFDKLSIYSQTQIQQKESLLGVFSHYFPILFFLMIVVGIILLFIGMKNWKKVQKNLDGLIEADRIKHELETTKMKHSEVFEKAVEEAKGPESTTLLPEKSAIMNYMDVEDHFFQNGISTHFKRRHYIQRNVKINSYEYDGIAISQSDNIDTIYEIKVWNHPRDYSMLRSTLERLYKSGANYETCKHRNFRCILVIATSSNSLSSMRQWVKNFRFDNSSYNLSNIDIQYYVDELIK